MNHCEIKIQKLPNFYVNKKLKNKVQQFQTRNLATDNATSLFQENDLVLRLFQENGLVLRCASFSTSCTVPNESYHF